MAFERIGFVASDAPEARQAAARLRQRYGDVEPEQADVVVALGGDGFMLETLHRFLGHRTPIYGVRVIAVVTAARLLGQALSAIDANFVHLGVSFFAAPNRLPCRPFAPCDDGI